VNENQGAESTLSYLLALLEMRAIDRPTIASDKSSPRSRPSSPPPVNLGPVASA
jgi:hypothetical protein